MDEIQRIVFQAIHKPVVVVSTVWVLLERHLTFNYLH